jgi:hypothetical protein
MRLMGFASPELFFMRAFALLVFALMALGPMFVGHQQRPIAQPMTDGRVEQTPEICASFPRALVRCGVWSSEQFESHRNDPSLRDHYSEIGIVQPLLLTADEWDYASFRGPTGIVWTPEKILIRAGERILRDRVGNTIRARCGNRLSPSPRRPVAFAMPPEMEQETAEISISEPPLLVGWPGKRPDDLVEPLPPLTSLLDNPEIPPAGVLELPVPPGSHHVIILPPYTAVQPVPPHTGAAPELQPSLLMSTALILLWMFARRRAKRRSH